MHPSGTTPADLVTLDDAQRSRVHRQLEREQVTCGACGGADFAVGDAVYLGFLFLSEPVDAWMVALTCAAPDCPSPRSAVRLHDPRGLLRTRR